MSRGVATLGVAMAVLAGAAAAVGAASTADDDLAVVKKAVSKEEPRPAVVARAEANPSTPARPGEAAPLLTGDDGPRPGRKLSGGREPQWLKIRVVERGSKPSRVSVNLPFAFVKGLADDDGGFPIDWKCRSHGKPCSVDIGAIVRALEAGQELVQVDADDSTVRVWVE